MSVIGKTHRLWVARKANVHDNELVALVHSMYDVPDENVVFTSIEVTVKWLVVKALDLHMKDPWIEIREDFTEAEWETWYAFKLVHVVKITKAGIDKPHRWEATLEDSSKRA